VPCESSKIQQVLLNIFRNGAYAMADAGIDSPMFSIRLNSLPDRAMVCIEMEVDTGNGDKVKFIIRLPV